MTEITSVTLDTEMDLMLANKQCVKLAELTGLPISGQTTFATAVSEICRSAIIGKYPNAMLTLYINSVKEQHRYIIATVRSPKEFVNVHSEGYLYARRLMSNIFINTSPTETVVEMRCRINSSAAIDEIGVAKLRIQLNSDPVISPYEEIKRRNRQLLELAEKLKLSEQLYRTLAETLPLHIYTVNNSGKIIYGNKWLRDFTGQTIEELNETGWRNVLHPEEFDIAWNNWPREDKDSLTSERRLRDKNGVYKWHTGTATFIDADDDANYTWNIYMVDIDAQKNIEQTLKDNLELKETQRKLEDNIKDLNESNRQLEQFAYVASHDLQEPLRKISFYSDYLNTKFKAKLGPDGAVICDNIINASLRMKGLIHDILSYSTIDASHQQIAVSVDLNEIADQAVQDLNVAIAAKRGAVSHYDLPTIQGNPGQLKQLFANIVSNSIKYVADDVSPEIHIDAKVQENNVQLFFKDNGIGFDPIFIDRMFDLFQRLHPKDKYAGTGIGLAICKKIVTLHHGNITATSESGHGSTFIVTLPLRQPNQNDVLS